MTGDGLAFVGESLHGYRGTATELLALLDEAGVDRALVGPVRPRGYHLGPANELVAEAVRERPERLVGLVRVDPNRGEDAVAEAVRGLDELGLAGVLLHPWEETFRISARLVDPVLEAVRDRGRFCVVAAGYPWVSEALQVAELARRFPDVPVVATNGAQLNISGLGQVDAELALEHAPNLFIQTGGVYREDFLRGVVARFGAERVVFASGYPLLDPRLEVLGVRWAGLGEAAETRILGANLEALLAARAERG
jgi:hypothetical protein